MFTDRTPEADTLPVVHIASVLTQGTGIMHLQIILRITIGF